MNDSVAYEIIRDAPVQEHRIRLKPNNGALITVQTRCDICKITRTCKPIVEVTIKKLD